MSCVREQWIPMSVAHLCAGQGSGLERAWNDTWLEGSRTLQGVNGSYCTHRASSLVGLAPYDVMESLLIRSLHDGVARLSFPSDPTKLLDSALPLDCTADCGQSSDAGQCFCRCGDEVRKGCGHAALPASADRRSRSVKRSDVGVQTEYVLRRGSGPSNTDAPSMYQSFRYA